MSFTVLFQTILVGNQSPKLSERSHSAERNPICLERGCLGFGGLVVIPWLSSNIET